MKGGVVLGIEPKTTGTSKSVFNEHFFYQSTA